MVGNQKLRVEGELIGQRLDMVLVAWLPQQTRSQWQQCIQNGDVKLDGRTGKPSERLKEGVVIEVRQASAQMVSTKETTKKASLNNKIEELYRDDDIIIINKPAGVSVHASSGPHSANTIASIFAFETYADESGRAGIVHRLDKDTSGVMVLARTRDALEFLQAQFKARTVEKYYTALVWGRLRQPEARIELPIGRHHARPTQMAVSPEGKQAITEYAVAHQYDSYSLLEIRLLTGRTHQIRVHLSYLGHPVVGDKVYGSRPRPEGLTRQFLHASSLTIALPNGEIKTFKAQLSSELQNFLEKLV